MNTVNFISDHIGWIIGNGKDISDWNPRWLAYDQGLRKPPSQISNPNRSVKDLWNDNKIWNLNMIPNTFNSNKDLNEISKPISKGLIISTKHFHKILSSMTTNSKNGTINWKNFWKIQVPQRVSLTGWTSLCKAILCEEMVGS